MWGVESGSVMKLEGEAKRETEKRQLILVPQEWMDDDGVTVVLLVRVNLCTSRQRFTQSTR